jgi:DNA-binding transcriptional MocR family regulator
MAKGKRRDSEGQYITLPYAQLKSEAWRSLSGAAVKVWLELHTRFNGSNNGNVRLSMNEAVSALGISKGTAQRAFVELEEKGFIALHTPGTWYHRKAHEWRLTTKRMQTRSGTQLATNDWRHWRKKTKDGPPEYPSSMPMGPPRNPKPASGSTREPVKAVSSRRLGTQVGH